MNDYSNIKEKIKDTAKGYIIAPAGCGKTQMICDIVNELQCECLVLTHTNAAVDVINSRVNSKKCIVSTLSSFTFKYLKSFCAIKNKQYVDINYDNMYFVFAEILACSIVEKVFYHSYKYVFVDEFQDCTIEQCAVINIISKIASTIVFGDEMQSIFNFPGKPTAGFKDLIGFECIAELTYPWRWKDNLELGNWLINIRGDYINGFSNVLNDKSISIIHGRKNLVKKVYELNSYSNEKNCIITKRKTQSIIYARLVNKYYVLEELEMRDLNNLIKSLCGSKEQIVIEILELFKKSITNTSEILTPIIKKFNNGDFNMSRIRKNNEVKELILKVYNLFDLNSIKSLYKGLVAIKKTKVIRMELLKNMFDVLRTYYINDCNFSINDYDFFMANVKRQNYKDTVAHTLLIKGLEYDNCIIIPDELTVNEMYVALTRARKRIYIYKED